MLVLKYPDLKKRPARKKFHFFPSEKLVKYLIFLGDFVNSLVLFTLQILNIKLDE